MSTTKPGLPQSPMKRMPKWLKITLSVFGVLFVLALIFGKSAPEQPTPPAAAPTTTISAPASKVPQPAEYVVAGIENGDTVELTGPAGTISARILGIETPPPTGDSCFRDEAYQWASLALSGKEVVAVVDEAQRTVVSLVLADGTDYVTLLRWAWRNLPDRLLLQPLAYHRLQYEKLIRTFRSFGLESFAVPESRR